MGTQFYLTISNQNSLISFRNEFAYEKGPKCLLPLLKKYVTYFEDFSFVRLEKEIVV